MLSKFTSNQKILIISGLVIIISLLICAILISFLRQTNSKDETTLGPTINFEYCGTALEEICLLSFGRDVYGNAVINVFVPDENFPDFYLNIIRKDSETVYLCVKSEIDKTRWLCRGEVLNLGEQVKVQILSIEEYHLLAEGEFLIKAILVMPQEESLQYGFDSQSIEMNTSTTITPSEAISTSETSQEASTITPQVSSTVTPQATSTTTPPVSYPNYP